MTTTHYNRIEGDDGGIDHWNYRLLEDETGLRIIEVYYDSTSSIMGWTEAGAPMGNDRDDVLAEIETMRLAVVDSPILTPDDLGPSEDFIAEHGAP